MSTETLMTASEQTPADGAAAATTATTGASDGQAAATQTVTGAESAAQGNDAAATQTIAGDGAQPTGRPAETKPAGGEEDPAKTKEPEGAPEKYEFKAPEGAGELASGVLESFSTVAKELNLPQDQAQKVIDAMAPAIAANQAKQIEAARTQWADEARADAEFGGDHLQENLAHAKRAMDTFATPKLKELLDTSGLGNHPELIRFMVRAGKAIGEDQLVTGSQAGAASHDAKRLYPNSSMH